MNKPLDFTYNITTYGCQMNEHDSSIMGCLLQQIGGKPAPHETADVLLYNTCCIREHAEDKVFGNVGALKKQLEARPDLIVGVCGCMMQQDDVAKKFMRRFPFVNFVMGTHNTHKLPEVLQEVMTTGKRVCDVWEKEGPVVEGLPVEFGDVCSYVNIMYGCNNFCTYCIVPYVRGRERSRDEDAIVAEIEKLAAHGTKEVMLLGQNVNSYAGGGDAFANLLRRVDKIEGIERIRFMTSHPKDISDSLMHAMAECDHVCKQLHLPMQSGSDEILHRMNRRYTAQQYYEKVEKLRALMPDIALTTDIIVGFPGETEEDFCDTLAMIEKVGFVTGYFFKYSPRMGTPAEKMEDQIDESIKSERLSRLLKLQNEKTTAYNESLVGKILFVLAER
ncbi:MAG: tRNA (N6-isopentenyl adenosine(37)-C2)-methylthiotransferase MiaB, partial [Clostridia bacterium]|nr:tRNA (N6-isopentenyl adenosine(37)-C2)-methylthiotransferase MiaB [Clostridia bacterium]